MKLNKKITKSLALSAAFLGLCAAQVPVFAHGSSSWVYLQPAPQVLWKHALVANMLRNIVQNVPGGNSITRGC